MATTSTDPRVRCVQGSATVAQVNAGIVIVPDVPGRVVTVVDGWLRAIGGAAGTATGVYIQDTAATAGSTLEWLIGALTQNAVARIGAANVTSTYAGVQMTRDKGIQMKTHGAALDTATSVDYCIYFTVSI